MSNMSNHPLVLRMRIGQGASPLASLSKATTASSPSSNNNTTTTNTTQQTTTPASPRIASKASPPPNSRKVSVMTGRLARSIVGYQTQNVQVYDLSSVHFNFEEGPQPGPTPY